MWLLIAFIAVPLIEITLFIQVGGAIGLGWTLTVVVLTAVLGTWLVRSQGALALGQLRSSFNDLRDPTEPLVHGAMILFSGALLLTPGFFHRCCRLCFPDPALPASGLQRDPRPGEGPELWHPGRHGPAPRPAGQTRPARSR
jgi:UPF0716 protein FxsA